MVWMGFDPGGLKKFGVAVLRLDGAPETCVVDSVDAALDKFKTISAKETIQAVGIDAPLWWSSKSGGGRNVDQWLRSTYGIPSGTVQSVNSLQGAAIAQGPLLARLIRKVSPGVLITETHPKALIHAADRLGDVGDAIDYYTDPVNLTSWGIPIAKEEDDERDALLGALAAREGSTGAWERDLASSSSHPSEWPLWVEDVHYWWP